MSHMITPHYNINDDTKKKTKVTSLLCAIKAVEVSCMHSFLADFLRSVYQNKISSYFSVTVSVTLFTTNMIPSKQTKSIKFDVKQLEKMLRLCNNG